MRTDYGADNLAEHVLWCPTPKPRNVTATAAERAMLLEAAGPAMKAWLLMCSDLAIRGGTAAKLSPANYDAASGVLTFRTKYQNAQQMPVTAELRRLLDTCTDKTLPFIAQLPRGERRNNWGTYELKPIGRAISGNKMGQAFARLRRRVGIKRSLTPHDFRRTTARNVYEITKDLRVVQAILGHGDLNSTVWYLQDNLVSVEVSTLELAKLNPTTEAIQ
jgi:integrase